MTYPEAIEFLYGLQLFGTNLGLENTRSLATLCGNPQDALRFIHVAGTNGKGSVCAMLESVYRHHGLRVGLFTSPHLISFTERIQVNRIPIPENEVVRITEMLSAQLGDNPDQWPFKPTFFEFVTVMALVYFKEAGCELVVWETGLGGRLDATNIVQPLASVITNIQFDHQQWLGSALAQIATEKAGIIKAAVPIITAVEPGEAFEVIERTAESLRAPLIRVKPPWIDGRLTQVSLLGEHQKINATVALATIDTLQAKLPVREEAITRGLANTVWPGRLQIIRHENTTVLLDGAHNPDGARTLARAIETSFSGREVTLVLGLFKDKDWPSICDVLVPRAARVFLVPLPSERSAEPIELLQHCTSHWPNVETRSFPSVEAGINESLRFPFVVIAGSLYLVGEAMQILGLVPDKGSERGLNEWDAGGAKAK